MSGYRTSTTSFRVTVEPFRVLGITSTNLRELQIKFNSELDITTLKLEYFKFDGVEAERVYLGLNNTVFMIIDNSVALSIVNGGTYPVCISDSIKDIHGNKLAEAYSASHRMFDIDIPSFVGAYLTGPKTFNIVFSEPIKTSGSVKIKKGLYGCMVGEAHSNTVVVTLAASQLPEGDYLVEISNFSDYAGYKIDNTSFILSYEKDTTPITALVTKSTQAWVEAKFNKKVILPGDPTQYFYHTSADKKPTSVISCNNTHYDDTWRLYFDDHPIPEGTTHITIKHEADGVKIMDEWGNVLTDSFTIPIGTAVDILPPNVVDIQVRSASEIRITFSEEIDDPENSNNIVIKDSDDNVIYPDDLSWGPHGNYLTISFNYMLYHGNYIVILKNIKDNSVNKNLMPETVMSFRINDVIPIDPTHVSALGDDGDFESGEDVIYIIYPEKMDPIYVLEASNYSLKSPGSNNFMQLDELVEEPRLMLFGTSRNTVVKIVIPGGSNQTVVGAELEINEATDYAGNKVEMPFVVNVLSLKRPEVSSVYQTDIDKLTYVFDQELYELLTDAFNIVIDNGTSVDHFTPGGLSWICKDGKTTVNVYLDESCIQSLKGINQDYGKDSSCMLTDINGVRLKLVGQYVVSIFGKKAENCEDLDIVNDKWAPSFVSMTVSNAVYGATVYLKFSEPLDDTHDWLFAHDLIIKDINGMPLIVGLDYTTTVTGDTIVITLPGIVLPLGDDEAKYTIETDESIFYIRDRAGNKAQGFFSRIFNNQT